MTTPGTLGGREAGPPVRVLHVGKFFPPARGGIEVFLSDLAQAQRAQGTEVAVLVHGTPQPGDPAWLFRVPVQVQLVYAPLALGFRAALARAIARFAPDVLHLHMPNISVFWALTLAQARALPWVVHWHSDVVASRIRPALALAYGAYRPFEQAVLARADRIIVTSPPYLQASQPLAPWRSACAVVPLGIAAGAELVPPPAAPVPGAPLRLLAIGRLAYYKGFETLLRAVAPMPGVSLVIVGAGECEAPLRALAAEIPAAAHGPVVRFAGEVDDAEKQRLLDAADLVCLPSRERTEAFGLVLLEAMRSAVPCLVSDLPGSGMSWVVRDSGAGWTAPVDDVPAWRAAIAAIAEQPEERQRRGQTGRQAFLQRFAVDACARALELHYRSLVRPRAEPSAQPRLLVVIPARDEAATIGAVVGALRAAGWLDVLVIDDQSTDQTAALAEAAGARVLRPVLSMGAWGAMQAGLRYGVAHGFTEVVTMDADGQHEVGEIPLLLAARDRADLVIGAYPERASVARRIAWHWFRRLAGFELRDLTSGFRYYNAQTMRLLASSAATLLDYQDLGTLLMLRRAGMRIVEVPVSMNLRAAGKSRIFHSWFSVGRYMAATTLMCLARRPLGRARPWD
ncbi:glycosyltransferase [Pseudorhodoferax sp.]|uniref:glycosyltransferase n=1 Tax=Pseudorhodoferax sp. TaxID=1993553 RepID=UPI002DD62446|nr:glycosyltransferase [Pseudorhodoferax sp.]